MTASPQSQAIKANRLLALLPQSEYARLPPHLKPVYLKKGAALYQAGDAVRYCYFPVCGVLSLLSPDAEGKTVEIGMCGNE